MLELFPEVKPALVDTQKYFVTVVYYTPLP